MFLKILDREPNRMSGVIISDKDEPYLGSANTGLLFARNLGPEMTFLTAVDAEDVASFDLSMDDAEQFFMACLNSIQKWREG